MTPARSTELELLIQCARAHVDEDRARHILDLAGGALDWNRLASLAWRHQLVPVLYKTLSDLGLNEIAPERIAYLKSLFEVQRVQNLMRISRLLAVLDALERAGVPAIPYKGPALAAYLYRDSALRQSVDLDLLVRPSDAIRARHVLVAAGYVPLRRIPERVLPLYVRLHYAFNFESKNNVMFDLQWASAPQFWRFPDIAPAAWERTERLDFAGTQVRWLAPADLLLALSLHGARHRWDTLKLLVDIADLVATHPDLDWDAVLGDAERAGAERMLGLALVLAHQVLEAPVPGSVLDAALALPNVAEAVTEARSGLYADLPDPMSAVHTVRFLARMSRRADTVLACYALVVAYFLRDHVVRPGLARLRRRPSPAG